MAVTLLQAAQRVARKVGIDPSFASFSDNDESNDIIQDLVEAYEDLLVMLPDETPYLQASGSISTVASTRTYSLAADALSPDLYEWSFENETENDQRLRFVTKDYVAKTDDKYDETEGKPEYVYLDGNNQLGFYPVPDGVYTINYLYAKHVATRLSATSDTFIIPDRWVRYVEMMAQAEYENRKRFSNPERTFSKAQLYLAEIMAEINKMFPTYFDGDGF